MDQVLEDERHRENQRRLLNIEIALWDPQNGLLSRTVEVESWAKIAAGLGAAGIVLLGAIFAAIVFLR